MIKPKLSSWRLVPGLLSLCVWGLARSSFAQMPPTDCSPQDLSESCVQTHIQALTAQQPKLAQRTPEHLVIALEGGRYRLLADAEQRLEAVALEPSAGFLVLRERHSHGHRWHVVSLKTGALTRTEGYAVFSPDGRHFLAFQNVSADGTSPGVARLFQAQHPVPQLVWRSPCEDDLLWGASTVLWSSNTQVTFVQTRLEDPSLAQAQEKGDVVVEMKGKRWQAKGLRCAKPVKP